MVFFVLMLVFSTISPSDICADQSTVLKFVDRIVTVQGVVPKDLPTLPAKGFMMYSGEDLEIMIWSCKDPGNPKSYWYYIMVYQPQAPKKTMEVILIYCDQEMGKMTFWADEEYFNGKPASRVLSQQKKKPDMQKLLIMKKKGFKFDI
jgi:hypothetical protein